MPPRLNLLTSRTPLSLLRSTQSSPSRTHDVALRSSNPSHCGFGAARLTVPSTTFSQRRLNSTDSGAGGKQGGNVSGGQQNNGATGPNQDTLPHVSEEAAQTARILERKEECRVGGDVGGPELEQGTPVEEMLKRDKDAAKYAPKVMRDESSSSKGTRSFSTSARARQQDMQRSSSGSEPYDPSIEAVSQMVASATSPEIVKEEVRIGHKFGLPEGRLPKSEHVRHRYEPVVEQLTKLMMRDGKLSAAQKRMAFILDHLRTSPPPQINPERPLLPGPPPAQLPLNPVLYLSLIIDSVAPLLKIRQQRGAAGGGASLPIPVPLYQRQRRRTAMKWILDAANAKRRENRAEQRIANELVAVAEGRSSVWMQRFQVHKLGVSARANLNWSPAKRR